MNLLSSRSSFLIKAAFRVCSVDSVAKQKASGLDLIELSDSSASSALLDEEDDFNEITEYHFVECTPLFVAYVYVNSASRVFEDRLVNRGALTEFKMTEFPDFEAVYHLVIDAVDNYNERWESSFRSQQQVSPFISSALSNLLFLTVPYLIHRTLCSSRS